jgi:flagellar biosynthetic protein FlhB
MAEGGDEGGGGERSQEPTQKKLDDARKRGDVPKSIEVNNWFLLSAGALSLLMFGGDAAKSLTVGLKGFISNAARIPVDGGALTQLTVSMSILVISTLALPLLFLVGAAIMGNIVQNGLIYSTEQIEPKFSKVSPMAGFKRLFSKTSLVNFAKGIAKLIIVGAAVVWAVWPRREELGLLATLDVSKLTPYSFDLMNSMLGTAIAVLTVLAIADWLYQRHSWLERQKMSFQELKEEYKQLEGDPTIKANIRQLRMQRARTRMMAQVPNASVIITNPTHYAVALKYEPGMNAPLCLAKGLDAIALKIRAVGTENDVPIVENPPLARALYASVEVDGEIPSEHYKAVAEVVGYVMNLKKKTGWRQ